MTEATKKKPCKRALPVSPCPYLDSIHKCIEDIGKIKGALIGDDMSQSGGLVRRIDMIEAKLKAKLSGKDKAILYGAFLTGLIAVIIEVIRQL